MMRSDNGAIDKMTKALTTEPASSCPEPSAPSPEARISIVTPSFNQGKFLEKTILSVLE